MGITYLDGPRLKAGVVAATQRILDVQERLNNINVFPVPDGDTGTNMALTMRSVADGAINAGELTLSPLSECLAESALMGARGNSGAILAQFFQGLADSFQGQERVDVTQFAESTGTAVAYAEQAIANPTEGTILTVMRDWNTAIQTHKQSASDLKDLLQQAFQEALRSLQRTPELLPVLAKAHVVDAGAQGFVNMLEGIGSYLENGQLEDWQPEDVPEGARPEFALSPEDIPFRYCTECLIEGENLDRNHIKASVDHMGNSLIAAGSTRRVKLHIHTDDPHRLFEIAAGFGIVSKTKFDDMKEQHQHHHGASKAKIALITDSSCDLPSEWLIQHNVRVVPVCLTIGNRSYLDRVEITAQEVYRMMETAGDLISTSQPSPGAYNKAYKMAAEQHDEALAIFLSSKLSGTWSAGKTAAERVEGLKVEVIDSCTVAGAMGLLVKVAAEAIEEGLSLEEVKQRVLMARSHTKVFVSLPSLDQLIRGGRVSKWRGWFARLFNLVPILGLDTEGHIKAMAKSKPGPASLRKVIDLVKEAAGDVTNIRFLVCHAGAMDTANYYVNQLKEAFALDHVDILEVSPTVGAHVGLGAAGICMLGFPQGDTP